MRILLLLLISQCLLAAGTPRYDQVTWLCTHNAMNSADDGWRMPNQTHTIARQLENGVGALMLDVHLQDGVIVLRHGPPIARLLGFKPLQEKLVVVRKHLEKNKAAVVTLIFESYVPAKDVAGVIKAAGLEPFCFVKRDGQPWPTLKAMRDSGKRLVVFSDRAAGDGVPAWYMPVWKHCWETDWQAKSKQDLLAAKPRRGKRANDLFILNHFITDGFPSKEASLEANQSPFLQQRVSQVIKMLKKQPNFLVLDFYELGDGAKLVKALND